jgi:hypothetical protein
VDIRYNGGGNIDFGRERQAVAAEALRLLKIGTWQYTTDGQERRR